MNVLLPAKSVSGVYVIPVSVALIWAVPLDGVVTDVMFKKLPSRSISFTSTLMSASWVFKAVLTRSSFAVGGELISLMVSVNVSESCNDGLPSSVTFTVMSYVPTSVNPGATKSVAVLLPGVFCNGTKASPFGWKPRSPMKVSAPPAVTLNN